MFEDRLVSVEDREWFQKLLHKRMSLDFQLDSTEVLGTTPVLYGDFMVANTDNKMYEEITDIAKVCSMVCHLRKDYKRGKGVIDFLLQHFFRPFTGIP